MTKRRFQPVPNYPGIMRIFYLSGETGKWGEPKRGGRFLAYRTDYSGGKKKKTYKTFSIFTDAVEFHRNENGSGSVTTVYQPSGGQSEGSKSTFVPSNRKMTFKELSETWKEVFLPTIGVSTQIRYRSYLKHLTFFDDLPVEEIETTTVDKWIVQLKKPEYLAGQHSTRCDYKHEYSVFKGILVFYVSRFNRNYRLPFIQEHRKTLKVKEKRKVEKDLTVDQFKNFIAELKTLLHGTRWEKVYYLALMQYAIYSRVQEAAALHYENFDFARGKIVINKKVQWLRSRGYKDEIVDGAKANGGKELPMSDLAKKVFQEMVLRFGIRSGPLFFVEGQVLSYRQIEHKYTKALKAAGLPFSATHILRHAALTEFYDTCKDLVQTAKVAGHSSIKSTVIYAKARDERVVQTQKQMDQKLSSLMS